MTTVLRASASLLLVFACTGCADWFSNNTTTAGAAPFRIEYDTVDLALLLDPNSKPQPETALTNDGEEKREGRRIDAAFKVYHDTYDGLKPSIQKAKRNQIQERLMGASDQLCHKYQQYMENVNSSGNFALGALTTVAGAAGALFTGGTSQVLSGVAGALSGTRAEFNQDFFYEQAVPVIMKGVNKQRERLYKEIKKNRQNDSAVDYPIERAIRDAIIYHSKCSIVAGVQELNERLTHAADVGMERVLELSRSQREDAELDTTKTDLLEAVPQARARIEEIAGGVEAALKPLDQVDEAGKTAVIAATPPRVALYKEALNSCETKLLEDASTLGAALSDLSKADEPTVAQREAAAKAEMYKAQKRIAAVEAAADSFEGEVAKLVASLTTLNKEAKAAGAPVDGDKVKGAIDAAYGTTAPVLACAQ